MKSQFRNRFFSLLALSATLLFSGCGKDDDNATVDPNQPTTGTSAWSGKLIHDWSSSIREYDFATKADPELFNGRMPYRMPNGNTLHIGGVFERLEMTNA